MVVVLLDCDGLLVDNSAFERSVTEHLAGAMAARRGIPLEYAVKLWTQDLRVTRSSFRWYDYDYHCERLGLPALAREAHEVSRHLLAPVPGAISTYSLLAESQATLGIVTDAVRWVALFKTDALGLRPPDVLITSDGVGATKASTAYWAALSAQQLQENVVIVDNRLGNLLAARTVMPSAGCILFDRQEHVLTLAADVAPDRGEAHLANEVNVPVVVDHAQLVAHLTSVV